MTVIQHAARFLCRECEQPRPEWENTFNHRLCRRPYRPTVRLLYAYSKSAYEICFLISVTYYWDRMSMCRCMWWYHDLTVVPLRFPIKYTAPSNFRWGKVPYWLPPIRPGQAKLALQAFLAKDSGVTVMTSRWRVWKPEGHTKETEISPSDRQGYMTLRVQLSKCCCCLSVVLSFSLARSLTISF